MIPGTPEPRAPDFFCIGAQKSGTTWLHENLRRHPEVWLSPVKEVQYFNQLHIPGHARWTQEHRNEHAGRMLKNYFRNQETFNFTYVRLLAHLTAPDVSDDWYRSVFSLAGPNRVAGDLTPEYSLLPDEGIEHILKVAPNAKFLFILRDPIARSWSHVRMLLRRQGKQTADFRKLITMPDVVQRSDYPTIIKKWRAHVSEENFKVGFLDEISETPEEFLKSIMAFLGVKFDTSYFGDVKAKVHKGDELEIPADIYDAMRKQYEPIYAEIAKEFPEYAEKWMAVHYR